VCLVFPFAKLCKHDCEKIKSLAAFLLFFCLAVAMKNVFTYAHAMIPSAACCEKYIQCQFLDWFVLKTEIAHFFELTNPRFSKRVVQQKQTQQS